MRQGDKSDGRVLFHRTGSISSDKSRSIGFVKKNATSVDSGGLVDVVELVVFCRIYDKVYMTSEKVITLLTVNLGNNSGYCVCVE